jgi:hypothetical protein
MERKVENDTESNSDAWRGALVVLALGSMLVGVFVLFAYGRSNEELNAFKRHLARLVEIVDRPEQEKQKASVMQKVKVDPDLGVPPSPGRHYGSPGAGAGSGGSGNSSVPEGGGTGNGGSPLPSHQYSSAGEALKDVLETYKLDPGRTSTISISTHGKVVKEQKGALTTYGLPTQTINEGIIVTAGPVPN